MSIKSVSLLLYIALLLMSLTGKVRAQEVSLPYRGLNLNGNLVLAPGKTVADGVILITHGTQAHNKLELFEHLQQLFSDKGRSTLAINLSLGINNRHGLYDCAIPSTYLHADAIGEIDAWVNWLKAQGVKDIVLLGHSRGGGQTAWYGAEHHDAAIKALVLLAPIVSTPETEAREFQKRFGKPLAPILDRAEALVKANKGKTLLQHIPFLFACTDGAVTAESFVSHYGADPRRNTPYWLPKLTQPTLVIVAGADEVNPYIGKLAPPLADGKRVQVKVIEGSDHFFRDLNADDAVDAALSFMNSQQAQ